MLFCNLLGTPLSRWKNEGKNYILAIGRPTTPLAMVNKGETIKCYDVNFKPSWFLWINMAVE